VAAVLAGGLGVLPACGSRTASAQDDATPSEARYYVSTFGIQIEMQVRYHEARTLTGVRLLAGGKPADAVFYPLDGSDPEPPPSTLSVTPGDVVTVDGVVQVPCTEEATLPVAEINSGAEGSTRIDRFAPDSLTDYRDAVEQWCARPFTMVVTGARTTPRGEQRLTLQLSNPKPDAVTIESRAVQGDGYAWDPTSIEVGGGRVATMTITGQSEVARECPPTPPWETDDLLVDGQPLYPSPEGASAC
jgi:hypothetical protein